MKRNIAIFRHSRGNHSVEQIMCYGRKVFEGTAKDARSWLVDERNKWRIMWRGACTDDKQRDYVDYKMGEFFAIDMDNQTWF